MNTMSREAPERQEIEALLPWHAAGTLSRRDAERVEQALANDRELARHFELVREELGETIHLNESLGAPSARAMEKLFAAIDAEAPVARKASFDLAGRISEFLASFAPRTLAYAATAAAALILVQGAVLTSVAVRDQSGTPTVLASADTTGSAPELVIRFAPQASVADITRFLDAHEAKVVDGPSKLRAYTVRLTGAKKPELPQIAQKIQGESKIVEFVAIKD
jgi:anti-sigma-K factor RskA